MKKSTLFAITSGLAISLSLLEFTKYSMDNYQWWIIMFLFNIGNIILFNKCK